MSGAAASAVGAARRGGWLVPAAIVATLLYGTLVAGGDLRERLPLYFAVHALLLALMLVAARALRRRPQGLGVALGAALAFRVVAALGEPSLSDDVYRYVWDGRLQVRGVHPYRFAPDDPALAGARDEVWPRINHRDVPTIYPPLGEAFFAAVAATGAGQRGFRLALGLVDFGVVLALGSLLRRRGCPPDRLVLYAWNPLAVLETAGSGHLEPLGVLLLLLAGAWIIDRRPALSTLAWAASVGVKLLPLLLLPAYLRRLRPAHVPLLLLALAAPVAFYAAWGPAWPAGLSVYAERWEHDSFVYAGIEWALSRADTAQLLKPLLGAFRARLGEGEIPWDLLYRHVWPRSIARGIVAVALVAASLWISLGRRTGVANPAGASLHDAERPRRVAADPGARGGAGALEREHLSILGLALLLSPTLHPWYVLWILPWAAAVGSRGWLVFAALAPLGYIEIGGDVPWIVRAIQYGPPLGLLAADLRASHR